MQVASPSSLRASEEKATTKKEAPFFNISFTHIPKLLLPDARLSSLIFPVFFPLCRFSTLLFSTICSVLDIVALSKPL
jgi:hypothetical protein